MTTEAQNFPLQYEFTTQRVIVRVSNVNDLNSETHIVCQRPNVFNVPYDSDSYLMMELTVSNCRRDSQRLQSSVANALNDIQQISNLKITDTIETNFLQDHLPKVDIDSSVNTIGMIRQKRSAPIFANFIQWLSKADDFWSLLDIQYRQNKTVFFHHDPNLQPSKHLVNFFDTYLQVLSKASTQMPFHLWLTKQPKRSSISYKTNGDINRYKSQTPFFPRVVHTNHINTATHHQH